LSPQSPPPYTFHTLSFEGGSSRSHNVEESFWRRLWTCRQTEYWLNEWMNNSSHLRTNSINFSSISEDNQAVLIASKHSKRSEGDVITVHIIRIEQIQTGSDPFRHVKHPRSATATERNWDVTETFLSVWTSPFNYTWENFTERWRSATERKLDV